MGELLLGLLLLGGAIAVGVCVTVVPVLWQRAARAQREADILIRLVEPALAGAYEAIPGVARSKIEIEALYDGVGAGPDAARREVLVAVAEKVEQGIVAREQVEQKLREEVFRTNELLRVEAVRALIRKQEETERYQQERWKALLNSLDDTRRAIILVQAEFRDNPLAKELVGRFMSTYDLIKQYSPTTQLDFEAIVAAAEQIALRKFTQDTGIKVQID